LDDDGVGLHDGLVRTNLAVVETTERDDRGAGALRPETGKCLGVSPFIEGRDRENFGRRDDSLTASAMNTGLKHVPIAFRLRNAGRDVKVSRSGP
jgi:hypothetical protein